MTSFEIADNDLAGIAGQVVVITGLGTHRHISSSATKVSQVHHRVSGSQLYDGSFNMAARSSQAISTPYHNPKFPLFPFTRPT